MNASLTSRLIEVTTPLTSSPVPPPLDMILDSGDQPANEAEVLAALLWPPGRLLGNRYRIGRVIQIGGMATVYEATQLDLVRRVAIKVPSAECAADSSCARRIEREARTLAGLQHPHIVSVFEFGRSEEGVAYMAMELVEGPTLRAHLMAQRTLPWRVAAECGAQIADALEVAHASGVVHGDVSASNVLLIRRGDTFVTKLIDFGVARRIDESGLRHRTFGTGRYTAPELFGGEPTSIPSDVFALGAVLKEMLGEATLATSPQALQQLLESMLDLDPQGRPKSAAEVALRLREALGSQLARPPRLRRRWMPAVVVGGTAICALVAYLDERTPVADAPEISAAVGPQIVSVHRGTGAVARVGPPPPEPVSIRAQRVAPVAVAVQQREPVAVPEAAPRPSGDVSGNELLDDDSERMDIVAALDRWLDARNQSVAGELVASTAARVGEPRVVLDPGGSSASVTYYKILVRWDEDRAEASIVEEQEFFTKLDGAWQNVTPESGENLEAQLP